MSEYNHPFNSINLPKTPTPQEITTLKEQGRTEFIKYIQNYYENKLFCYDKEHKKTLSCECYKSLFSSDYSNELANAIAELCTAQKEEK